MPFKKCGGGGGLYVDPVCHFDIGEIAGIILMRVGAPNPFAGADAAAQIANMADQTIWTTGTTDPLPDNLYLSPRSDENDFPQVFDDFSEFGYRKRKTKTSNGVSDAVLTFGSVRPAEFAQLDAWNDVPVQFMLVNADGEIGHKVITNGTDSPFFVSNSGCMVSSLGKSTGSTENYQMTIPLARNWSKDLEEDAVDAASITQIQSLLSNQ